jgi:ribosome maturation factor RimP
MENLEKQIESMISQCGVQLYDINNIKEDETNIYRIYITAKGGVNLDKCAEVSRLISPLLDVEEPMSGNYNLEVSSPGIERKLTRERHYKASIGDKIRVKTNEKETLKGELIDANDQSITLKISEEEELEIKYSDINKSSTYFEW